jgi:phosphoglycerol transferase MdoB-like AlkP superfamily enzyme
MGASLSFEATPMTFAPERWVGRLPRLPLLMALLLLVVFTLTRLGLAVLVGLDAVPLNLWPGVLGRGLWFDVAVVAFLLAPVCLYEALLPDRWRRSRIHGVLRLAWLWLVIAVLLFGAVAEATFWLEFSTRFNFIAVDYLLYTQEVIGNIRQSYPVGWIFAGIGVAAAIITVVLARNVRRLDRVPLTWRQRTALAAAAITAPLLSVTLASVEQMQGAGNAFAEELSGNGLFTLAAAMRRNELDYDRFYRTLAQPEADAVLARLGVRRPSLGQAAPRAAAPLSAHFVRRPKSVVLISVESLSASFIGAYGADGGLTPQIDALARDGLKFERVFATGTRTVRGLEALSLGTPPIPGQSIVRRPGNAHLSTLGELLRPQGVKPFFFYGGYGYFDNMNAYFGANSYEVVDRTDIPKASVVFENVWGVADETLYEHVLRTLDTQPAGQPFFAHIMTTSNHRPFTYPQGRIDIASPGGREGGVKYTDYAIGRFIAEARSRPWFADTLFVITADHCASVAGKTQLPVDKYHIPLVFYAPKLLAPGTHEKMISQVDIAPTLLEVLGRRGAEQFYGHSAFAAGAVERAFISNYQALGYLRDGVLTVLLPKGRVESYRVDPKTLASSPAEVEPRLLAEAIAYYQSAARAFKRGELRAPLLGAEEVARAAAVLP